MGNPDIHNGIFEPWNSSLVSLARHPNVHIKVSGALEEAAAGEYGNWFVVANVSLCYFLVPTVVRRCPTRHTSLLFRDERTVAQIRPFVRAVISAFGYERFDFFHC